MCERKTRKIAKGSQLARLREARRLQRLQRLIAPVIHDESPTQTQNPQVDKVAQNRVILELALKTVALMQKNRLIQEKIVALQKETSEFIAAVMRNPENKKTYMEHVRMYRLQSQAPTQQPFDSTQNFPVKLEPTV